MTFNALARALRDRWLTVAAGVAVGFLVAGLFALVAPRTYASTASLYVSAYDDTDSAQSAYQGSLLSQQRIKSYSELVLSDRVLAPAIDGSGIGGTTAALVDRVTVTSSPDSTVLGITVTDSDPTRAAATVNAVAGRFTDVVAQLERPQTPGAQPRVTVNLVDPGKVDAAPVSPQVGVDLLVGLVLGLLAGAATAVVRTAFDTSVRTAADLAGVLSVPSLGALPVDPAMQTNALALPVASGYREAVRRIRTNLLFADVDEPPRLITVTSARAGEGKTTMVCALAEAFATGGRVCVVEGDLRRPTIADRLGLVPTVGLTDVLARRTTVRGATQRWGSSAVDVLVAGGTPHNPSELLSSRTMRETLAELRAEYDLVLLDAPPLLPVADGAVLASRSDGAILLCRQGSTTRAQMTSSVEALTAVGARVLGGVLSMTTAPRGDGSAYGYGDPYVAEYSARPAGGGPRHGRRAGGPGTAGPSGDAGTGDAGTGAPPQMPRLPVPAQSSATPPAPSPATPPAPSPATPPAGTVAPAGPSPQATEVSVEQEPDAAPAASAVPSALRRRGPSRLTPRSPDATPG